MKYESDLINYFSGKDPNIVALKEEIMCCGPNNELKVYAVI